MFWFFPCTYTLLVLLGAGSSLHDNIPASHRTGDRTIPEITLLGWFHTALGIIALASGFYTLAKHKEIRPLNRVGQVYLLATLVTALSALGIFQHGGFGAAHGLAVMTLLGLALGTLAAKTMMFGKLSRYVQAIGYTATLLFHMIPATTDFLLRIPVGDPFLTSIEDPVMKTSYLGLLVIFVIGLSAQLLWIRRQ